MQKTLQKTYSGFTLIELLVVATIIIVVSAIGLVSYSEVSQGARDARRKSDLDDIRVTLLLFRSENGYYPTAAVESDSRVALVQPRKIFARLLESLSAPSVFAASDTQIAVSDSIGEELIIDDSQNPNPTLTPTPTATPPKFEEENGAVTKPPAAQSYDDLMEELVAQGYLQSDTVKFDPINNSEYYYGYTTPDSQSFELTAILEKDGSVVRLTN